MEAEETKSKTTIINNVNIKSNPFTTVLGIVITLVAIGMLVVPMFLETKTIVPYYIIGITGAVGIFLVFAPDKLIGILSKVIDKKTE